jgi:hypothetical protein
MAFANVENNDELDTHLQNFENQQQSSMPSKVPVDFSDEPMVIGGTKPVPKAPLGSEAQLSNVEEGSPEDKSLEDKYLAEDFDAGEKSDKVAKKAPEKSEEKEEPNEEDDSESEEETASEEPSKEITPEEQSSIQRLLSSLKPEASKGMSPIEEAQKERDRQTNLHNLDRAAALIGSSIAKQDPEIMQKLLDRFKEPTDAVTKLKEKTDYNQYDPKSEMSSVMRNYLTSKGIKISDNASAADILKVAPYLAKDASLQNLLQRTLLTQTVKQQEGEKNRESAEKRAEMYQKARLEQTKALTGTRQDINMQHRLDAINKALREGGGQPVIQNRLALQRSQNLFLTNGIDPTIDSKDIDKIPDSKLNKVNRIQVMENGIELNRLLTGTGIAAQNTLNKLVPNNASMTATQMQDYITNKLNPADQAKVIKAYLQIGARVRDQNKENLKKYQKQVLSGAGQVLDYFPEQKKMLLNEHDLSMDDLKGSKMTPQAPSSAHKPGDIVSYKGKQYKVGNDGDTLEEIQ